MNVDPRVLAKPSPTLRDYYIGVDLGQKRDYTVVAIVEKKNRHLTLRHVKQFPLGTEYNAIVEYLKLVAEEFSTVRGFYIDRTGVGEVFVENCQKHGLKNVQGIVLTMPEKQEVMTCLKQTMLEKRLHMPRDREMENEMNGEIAEITATGKTKFYHRSGTHDDRLWAVGLAVYGARYDIEPYHPFVALGRRKDILGRYRGPDWTDWLKIIRGETTQDKHDQLMSGTNLSARILGKDPRAMLSMEAPSVQSLPWEAKGMWRGECVSSVGQATFPNQEETALADTSNTTGQSCHKRGGENITMNSSAKNEYVRKLVEQYGPRETFRSLAARILIPETTRELHRSTQVPTEPRKIILNKQVLRKMRTRPRGPITLPSQGEALYWLRRWQRRWDKEPNTVEG